jgi:thiamine-phosphate pyrophosphorylase
MAVDLRLYALLDPATSGTHSLGTLARMIAASTTLVQLRSKEATTRSMIEDARAIKAALPKNVPLLINDRVDVALATSAEGVHLGWDDMEPADARVLLGDKAVIGFSVKTIAQAQSAPLDVLDYVAVGGVFNTSSKNNTDPPVGLAGMRNIISTLRARAPRMPVVAIAGINATNADSVVRSGADGVAVISALSLAADPAAAARDLRGIVDRALAQRGGK